MNKEQIVKSACDTAEFNNFKGKMLSFSDGNTFLWRDNGSLNAALNHAQFTKKDGQEPNIFIVDNSGAKPTCEVRTSKELLDELQEAAKTGSEGGAVANTPPTEPAIVPVDYPKLNNDKLKALLAERGIDASKATKKDEYVALLVADDAAKASTDNQ